MAGSGPYSELIDPILIKEQSIQKAPVVTSHLGAITGKLGEQVSLVVEYSSATPADVKWYRKSEIDFFSVFNCL